MKRVNIKCPYCGSQAFLRPASVVFGEKATDPTAPYYVCAHYPACDSYVSAHRASHMPMGTLADAALRHKRIEAHAAMGKWPDEQAPGVPLASSEDGPAREGGPHRQILHLPL